MGGQKKDGLAAQIEKRMLARTVGEHAQYQAAIWIALHGVKKAETIASLALEKIRAQMK